MHWTYRAFSIQKYRLAEERVKQQVQHTASPPDRQTSTRTKHSPHSRDGHLHASQAVLDAGETQHTRVGKPGRMCTANTNHSRELSFVYLVTGSSGGNRKPPNSVRGAGRPPVVFSTQRRRINVEHTLSNTVCNGRMRGRHTEHETLN